MKPKFLAVVLLFMCCLVSCDDTTDTIGQSLTDNTDYLKVTTDTFKVTTQSIVVDSVLANSSTGYLGRIKDPETNACINSDFMLQLHLIEGFQFPPKDSIASVDAAGEVVADSCEIRLFFDSYYGDSLATIKLITYEMDTPMKENQNYYSNYDPIANGYIRKDGLKKEKVFTLADKTLSEKYRASDSYTSNIHIRLNDPYTDKNGVTYNNYGTYLLRTYYAHPEYFKNTQMFLKYVNPGFYFKTADGLGAMACIMGSKMNINYRIHSSDTISKVSSTYAGTEEVLQTTTVSNDKEMIHQLAADNSCTYLKTPAGIFTEVTFPVEEIIYNHATDTLNTAKIVFTRINNDKQSDYALSYPTNLLMVERDSMYTFFENKVNVDNKQSYLATVSGNTYTFSNISNLIRHMINTREKGILSDSNWDEKHPNWNKVVLIPVTLTTTGSSTTTTTIVKISNDMSLKSTRLVGGSQNPYDDIKMSIIYSKFSD